jgi:hypothetical protein
MKKNKFYNIDTRYVGGDVVDSVQKFLDGAGDVPESE